MADGVRGTGVEPDVGQPSRGPVPRGRVVAATLCAAGVALAVPAAFTHPFTWAANLVVIGGFVVVLGIVALQRAWPGAPAGIARRPAVDGRPGYQSCPCRQPRPSRLGIPRDPDGRPWGRRWAVWLVPLAGVVGWELFCYASSPRDAHPTISSLLDSLDASRPVHAVAFALWLAFGWYLVTR